MSFITLDFETYFNSRNRQADGSPVTNKNTQEIAQPVFSLKFLTYEEYLYDPRFLTQGVGIKIDREPTVWITDDIAYHLKSIFTPGNNHAMLAHNVPFDGAILSWLYGLQAAKYYCTQGMSNALWAQASASLDALAQRLWPDDESKRKGTELMTVDGIRELNSEQQEVLGGYCIQDVDLTFDAFAEMVRYFPHKELDVMDMTHRMFIHPQIVLDRPLVQSHMEAEIEKHKQLVAASGWPESVLNSNDKFAARLERDHGVVIPTVASPTPKNPNNTKLALGKDDLEFVSIRAEHPELKPVWDARISVKGSTERKRGPRLLLHAEPNQFNPDGRLALLLKYCGAHTKRWSGTNKINPQNFKRGSPYRLALRAPHGHKILVRDLSNIEGRMNAWFNQETWKCEAFAAGRDLYNELASEIYGRPVDRKKKLVDAHGNYLNADGQIVDNKDDAAEPDWLEGFVGKTAELGLGYNMGSNKFWTQCAMKGVTLPREIAALTVNTWRRKNAAIVRGWKRNEQVIFDMASPGMQPYDYRCLRIERGRIILPSGLPMTYPKLEFFEEGEKRGFHYWEGKFFKSLYGGLLMENIIQALARIVMSDMMVDIQQHLLPMGGVIALTVHDEIVAVAPDQHADEAYAMMGEIMATPPAWCNDGTLALASAGGIADNYSK